MSVRIDVSLHSIVIACRVCESFAEVYSSYGAAIRSAHEHIQLTHNGDRRMFNALSAHRRRHAAPS